MTKPRLFAACALLALLAPLDVLAQHASLVVLHAFGEGDGYALAGVVLGRDGNLYGVSSKDGGKDGGTFFRLSPTGVFTPLRAFDSRLDFSAEDPGPDAALVQGRDGNFYGTSSGGGYHQWGRIIRLTPAGAETVLWKFHYHDGAGPNGSLAQGRNGSFYGITDGGGVDNGSGTAFRCASDGSLTTLHWFGLHSKSGSEPRGGLLLGRDGRLYGATSYGEKKGPCGGKLFRLTPSGALTVLHTFTPREGYMQHPLAQGRDGNFYGTTTGEFTPGHGLIFRVTPGGVFTVLHRFSGHDGDEGASSGLLLGMDSSFYGAISAGRWSKKAGSLYRITADGTLNTLYRFNTHNGDGANPFDELTQGADGSLYGVTKAGGNGWGTVYRLTLTAAPDALPTARLSAPMKEKPSYQLPSDFLFTLSSAQTHDVLVRYTVGGTAVSGVDYPPLSGTVRIKAGRTEERIHITDRPIIKGNDAVEQALTGVRGGKTVMLALAPSAGYTVGTLGMIKIEITPKS